MMNLKSHLLGGAAAFMLLSLSMACGETSSTDLPPGSVAPTVLSSVPVNGAIDVALNGSVSATFSEAMDPASLTGATFTLTSGVNSIPVAGTVVYANSRVVFWPAAHFDSQGSYTATITTGARSASGHAMAVKTAWSFPEPTRS